MPFSQSRRRLLEHRSLFSLLGLRISYNTEHRALPTTSPKQPLNESHTLQHKVPGQGISSCFCNKAASPNGPDAKDPTSSLSTGNLKLPDSERAAALQYSIPFTPLPWYFRTFQRTDDKEEWTSCMENHHYDEKIFLEGGKKKGFK